MISMIFVAGISPKLKPTGSTECPCPACGRIASLYIVKQYSAVTLFFIPVILFGAEYIATCSSCASTLALPKDKGRALERDSGARLYPEDLSIVKNNAGQCCNRCESRVQPDQNFCPKCGGKL